MKTARYVSPHGYTDDYGPNVSKILCQGTRVIRGRLPAQVRAELREAVKDGVLGRLPKDGLKPEVFFHPDRRNGAKEIQAREASYSVGCIATVMAVIPVEQRVEEAIAAIARTARQETPQVDEASSREEQDLLLLEKEGISGPHVPTRDLRLWLHPIGPASRRKP